MSKGDDTEIIDLLLKNLKKSGMDSKPISNVSTRNLRGGLKCIELYGVRFIDSVVLLSKFYSYELDSGHLYKLDYALRGDIKGILSGRIITTAKLKLKGLLKRKIENLEWIVPKEKNKEKYIGTSKREGIPPQPGEVWDNGPHQTLTKKLNHDRDLNKKIIEYLKKKSEYGLKLTLFSDRWGESLRLSGGIWLESDRMIDIYASKIYIGIASDIFMHVTEVRRYFGGLTF